MRLSRLSKVDLHLLQVFVSVVKAQGFSAAQVSLNVSTSTISRQIADLELRLGMRLCQRGRVGFRLTDKGQLVYNAALKLFASLEEFSGTIEGSRGKLVGQLSLAVIDNWITNPEASIVPVLAKFCMAAPDVHIELHSLAPDDIEYSVLDGHITIGIGVFHNHKPGLLYQQISSEFMGLYCGRGHPLFEISDPQEEERLLQAANLAKRAYLSEEKVAPVSIGLKSTANAHQVESVALLVLTGNFVGYLPESYAHPWVVEGRMKKVLDGKYDLPTNIEIVTKRGSKLNLVARTFLKYVGEETGTDSCP
ncbi:LysR family transcriptional regulator [Nitratireductor sp. XY-223]|uniref:LysR family transcriptional regulator n=1 Tax=Nitratireductor sp. XY-223 TaxID=2561926 RepID=UPI0010AAF916|nr:LysR family transcriptional regulator [Nitratireductor sp. XY-223]